MRYHHVEQLADHFWAAVGVPASYPRDLETPVLWTLPLAVAKLPRLWVRDVYDWLAQRSIAFSLGTHDRPLHGCLLAYEGRGFVLLNGADSSAEQRFSLAHEVAHFLTDYLHPRREAVQRLGRDILEVFDGKRAPTIEERALALLGQVNIGFHAHLMERHRSGVMGCQIAGEAEETADRLAMELLAPQHTVRRRVSDQRRHDKDPSSYRDTATRTLQQDFGLPAAVAEEYARQLYPERQTLNISDWLRQRE